MDLRGTLAVLPLGAILGYVAGIISDPVKARVNDWRESRLLRRSLYAEMAHNYLGLRTCLAPEYLSLLEHKFADNVTQYTRVQAYRYAKEQHRLFLGLREWSQITSIYEPLLRITGAQSPSAVKASQAKALIVLVEEATLSNFLNLKQFSKVAPDITPLIREIKEGKRKKSSEIYASEYSKMLAENAPSPIPPFLS